MNRREFVSASVPVTGLLMGCSFPISFGGGVETDLFVENRTDTEITVDISVTGDANSETIVEETVTLAGYANGNYSTSYSDLGDTGTATAHIAVRDGPEDTFEFGLPSDSESFEIQIHPDSFETVEGNA